MLGSFGRKRSPAPPAFGQGKVIPEGDASFLSRLTFSWLSPFLAVGFSRPLEKDDLWSLPTPLLTRTLTDSIQSSFYVRVPPEQQPFSLRHTFLNLDSGRRASEKDMKATKELIELKDMSSGTLADAWKSSDSTFELSRFSLKAEEPKKCNHSKRPLLAALHSSFFWRWWLAGFLKLCADTLKTTTPLVTKILLSWLSEASAFHSSGGTTVQPRGVGYGIGLGLALFIMQEVSSLMTNHYMMTSMSIGLSVRTGLVGAIFRKSLRLSVRARMKHSVGQVTTMISTDATRLDIVSAYAHNLWVAPIQIIIGIALLINNLGYSALIGLGVLLLGFPIQFVLVRIMFRARQAGVQLTDQRVRLTTEVLQGIRLIKFCAWEAFYANRIGALREKEVTKIRHIAFARAGLISIVTIIPILASVLSFITYALSGHNLNAATIFSSLQLFNIIRTPLIYFPIDFSNVSDALVALKRIESFLTAEEFDVPYNIDTSESNTWAISAEGDFTWETVGKANAERDSRGSAGRKGWGHNTGKEGRSGAVDIRSEDVVAEKATKGKKRWWGARKRGKEVVLPLSAKSEVKRNSKENDDGKPFALTDLTLQIPKGAFVAIVGRIGSGKSSLLQGLMGEMRKVNGEVVFGGSVAYVPQQPWIMNATLRENILFGQEEDEKKFNDVIHACSLGHDIETLPNRIHTEIGEKGVNLSGGQKARISLARAAYSDADVILLDDPLSAVDMHVGKAILENCIVGGPLARKTRVLVTHALHALARTDYIYVMEAGVIKERGTYDELMKGDCAFSQLIAEHESLEKGEKSAQRKAREDAASTSTTAPYKARSEDALAQLMTEEERNRGSVPFSVYSKYLKHAGGAVWGPVIVLLLTLTQGSSIGNNLFLGFWTSNSIRDFSQGEYMGVYAAFGIAQAFCSFVVSFAFSLIALYASLRMFKAALQGILWSPMAFFDTTPMGRVTSRLSKDQDILDAQLSLTLIQLLSTFSNVIGAAVLVFYTLPYLGIIFVPLGVLYYAVSTFYRRSSVETKRLDSLMRSSLYASYSETLTGLSTVRAYGQKRRVIDTAERALDLENRAYYMTVSIQRWLSTRLDLFGNILILGIVFFASGFKDTVNTSKIGVVLSYTLNITQVLSDMVSQFAQNEQNMNAAERILHYIDLPREAASIVSSDPPLSWPDNGEIRFKEVKLEYREGLPLVLKGVTFDVKSGEKVGIVGRTGAGKSTLLQALFRMIELRSGSIEIDGVDIRTVGLDTLRRQLALVSQDSTLFSGTLRHNLDPENRRTDAEIISALRRVSLLPDGGHIGDSDPDIKFDLGAVVSDEGSNYSAGEKQLLALCRVLLKHKRIIVLDEATSSVDGKTDLKIQDTIRTEFSSCTILCIAHRLNTIAYYDRVLVLDSGKVAEFDTPLNLYSKEDSIFRSLCDEAGYHLETGQGRN